MIREEAKQESKKGGKRGFKGFKAKLIAKLKNININVDIRYERLTAKEIEEFVKESIEARVNGKPVKRRAVCSKCGEVTNIKYFYVDDDGNRYDEKQVEYYQNLDGKWIPIEKLSRTKEIECREIPLVKLEDYLIESEYELFADNPHSHNALLDLANYLRENNLALASRYSSGGFREYIAFIYPKFLDGGFILIMALTRTKKQYRHIMPTTPIEIKKSEKAKPVLLKLDDFV